MRSLEIAKRINDQGAALMEHNSDQVVMMPTLSPFDEDHLAEAGRCLHKLGMKGIFIETSTNGTFLDDPATYPFWEYVEDRGVAIFLHPPMLPIA